MNRVTITDVAKLAGVSTATVSRVLTGSAQVSPTLRERVTAAADQLNYTVNAAARALRQDRTNTIGVVVPELSNPFFTLLADAFEYHLNGLGMSLLVCSSRNDTQLEVKQIRSLVASRVDVVVVTPAHMTGSVPGLRWAAERSPIIQLDQYAQGIVSDWIGVDDAHGLDLIVEHLAARGVKTARYLGAKLGSSSAHIRHDAVIRSATSHGIALDHDPRFLGEFSSEWGRTATQLSLAQGPVDALICAADVIALGALEVLDAQGIRVPQDVLVTGFDDIPLAGHPRLSLTTVRQPIEAIAAHMASTVSALAEGHNERAVTSTAIPPQLVVRGSSEFRLTRP